MSAKNSRVKRPTWPWSNSLDKRKLFFFNAGFDRKLSGEGVPEKIQKAIDSMALLLVPALPENSSIYSPLSVPSDFIDYLHSKGISTAQTTTGTESFQTGEAWGADHEAVSFFKDKEIPYSSPSLDIVAKVNSRLFSYTVSKALMCGIPQAVLIKSMQELKDFTYAHKHSVLKPLFGNAGSGFVYIGFESNQHIASPLKPSIQQPIVGEPWLQKTLDIATLLHISETGNIKIIGHHRNISNRAGTFYANVIMHSDPQIKPYRTQLDTLTTQIGKSLFSSGYWGPVGIDSLLYKNGNSEKLTCGFDINARHPISSISYGIREKLGNPPVFKYRFIAKRRMKGYNSLQELLSEINTIPLAQDQRIILASPFCATDCEGKMYFPGRYAFIITADTHSQLEEADHLLRQAILK